MAVPHSAIFQFALRTSPVIFGIGFLAPVITQSAAALGFGDTSHRMAIGLAIGGGWGLFASIWGRWL